MEFLSCFIYSRSVVRINNKNQPLGAGEVMSPERSNLVLAADIPNVELDVLVCNRLDVEADCRNSGDILPELQLVQDRYRPR